MWERDRGRCSTGLWTPAFALASSRKLWGFRHPHSCCSPGDAAWSERVQAVDDRVPGPRGCPGAGGCLPSTPVHSLYLRNGTGFMETGRLHGRQEQAELRAQGVSGHWPDLPCDCVLAAQVLGLQLCATKPGFLM